MVEDLQQETAATPPPGVDELFGALFLHATDCILFTRTDGGVLRANPAACRALVRTEEQIRSEGRTGLVVANDEARRMLAERARSGVATGELTFRRPDGSTFVAEVTTTLLRSGTAAGYAYVTFKDLTARREAERLAAEQMEFLRTVLDTALDGLVLVDGEGRLVDANSAYCTMSGYGRDELLRMRISDLDANESPEETARHIQLVREKGSDFFETRHRRKDGSIILVLAKGRVVNVGQELIVGSFQDITERRRAEEALRNARDYLENLIDHANAPMIVWDPRRKITLFNNAFEAMTGYSEAEVMGKDLELLFPPESRDESLAKIAVTAGGRRWESVEIPFRCKSGEKRVVLWNSANVYEAEGISLQATIAQGQDITDRKRAEDALRESENRFRTLARTAPAGILQTDMQGRPVFVNPAFLAMTGLTEAEALDVQAARSIHPEDRERVAREWRQALTDETSFTSEYRYLLPEGRGSWVRAYGATIRDASGAAEGFVGVIVDITETRALQARLAMASRLAAMGTLVAGVAHEINNPLAADLAGQGVALELAREARNRFAAQETLEREAEIRFIDEMIEALVDANEGGQRVAHIVKDLANFARRDLQRAPTKLADVVQDALRWLPASLSSGAAIRVEDEGAPDVFASAGQIEQVVVNLVSNAVKATPAGQHGDVLVRIRPGSPGMARLEVVDHGTGIEPAILDRIFEPFFTTRQLGDGRGVGLGLSISHSIVASHGGTLTVGSEVGRGSTFRMELPVAGAG